MLVEHPDLHRLIDDTFSFRRPLFACYDSHQRRFAATVSADDRDPLACVEVEIHIIEKKFDIILFFDMEEIDKCH
jgi:hypothetical protein